MLTLFNIIRKHLDVVALLVFVSLISLSAGLLNRVQAMPINPNQESAQTVAPPSVVSVEPADGNTNVSVDTTITVRFNTSLNPNTVSGDNVKLWPDTTPINVQLSGSVITIRPQQPLLYDTPYTIRLSGNIESSDGVRMGSEERFYFTTEPTPTFTPIPPTATPTFTPIPPTATPPGPRLTANPTSVQADGTVATINLLNAPVGCRIRFFSKRGNIDTFTNAIGTVNNNGKLTTEIHSTTPGTAMIEVKGLSDGCIFVVSQIPIEFTALPGQPTPMPANEWDISITEVNPKYSLNGRYLAGIPVSNPIDVTVDWGKGTPDRVEFILNGVAHSEKASISGANHTFNMGSDLKGGNNTLNIVAYDTAGHSSATKTFAAFSMPLPVWLAGLQTVGAMAPMAMGGSWSGGYGYNASIKFPPKGINLGAPGFGPPESKTKLGFFIGGGFELPLACGEPIGITVQGGAEAEVDLLSVKLGGEVNVNGSLEGRVVQCEIPTINGNVKVEFKVYGQKDWPAIIFIANFISPGAGDAIQVVIPKKVLNSFGEVYLQGNFGGSFSSGVQVISESPYLQWQGIQFGAGPGIKTGYEFKKIGVELNVYLGATGKIEFFNPNPINDLTNLNFSHVTISGEAGYKIITLGILEEERKFIIEWRYPPGRLRSFPLSSDSASPKLRLIKHNLSPTYSTFQARSRSFQAFAPTSTQSRALGLKAQSVATSVLVSNVYTYSSPSLAVNPTTDNALMVWVHDVVTKPVGQGHEINFSRWDGSSWREPAAVTNDNYLDGVPQIAWADNNNAVAIWQRLNDLLSIDATWNITTAKKLEIAASVYNSTTNKWTPVTLLTTNTALDTEPRLARNSNGQLLAIWRQNKAGVLGGDVSTPDSIIAAFYANGWNTPAVAVDNIPGLVELAVGYNNNEAIIAYTYFLTPTNYPTPTLQLFTSSWNGITWSSPVKRTNDLLNHHNPQVVYNTISQPLLVWLAGDELRLHNLTTNDTTSLTLPEEVGSIDEFRVVQDKIGNIAVVFTAQREQRDLYVALYDKTNNLWSKPIHLTNDQAKENYPSSAIDSTGRLLMGYATTDITSITQTTTIPDTGQVITHPASIEGEIDLMTLAYKFSKNLTLNNSDLSMSNSHPTPGSNVILTATVHNSGDFAVNGVTVNFFDGDPATGGTAIATRSLPYSLAGGFTATLTTTYNIPVDSQATHVLYAIVDVTDTIAESDETDNKATLVLGPDLEITEAGVDYWDGSDVGLLTLIRNTGTVATSKTTLNFYRDGLTSTLIVTDTIPSLATGEVITMTTPWNFANLVNGHYPLVAVVNQTGVNEIIISNNVYTFTLDVLPDLMVSPHYLWTIPLNETKTSITATIYNIGSVQATDVIVAFYRNQTLDSSALAFTQTISTLAPGSTTQVGGQIDSSTGTKVYVLIDPEYSLIETTRANNLASVTVEKRFSTVTNIYLPLVIKQPTNTPIPQPTSTPTYTPFPTNTPQPTPTRPPTSVPAPTGTTPPTATPTPYTYFDDFSDPNSGWYVNESSDNKFGYINGEYEIQIFNLNWWSGVSAPKKVTPPYSVSVDAHVRSGQVNQGLIFDFVDWKNFYVFFINTEYGDYRFVVVVNGQWSVIQDWEVSSHINNDLPGGQDVNNLKIERNGSSITAYVNNNYLTTIYDSRFLTGRTGFLSEATYTSPTSLRFDNFYLQELGSGRKTGGLRKVESSAYDEASNTTGRK